MDGYVSTIGRSTRILAHTKVDSLPFKFASGQPFSIYPRPKDPASTEIDTLIKCKLHQDEDDNDIDFPVQLFNWTPALIVELREIDLSRYDVYVGCDNELECDDIGQGKAPDPMKETLDGTSITSI